MNAPAIVRDLFIALQKELGEEDDGVAFDNGPGPLDRIDVLVHRATDPSGVTVLTTVGMCVEPMPAPEGRPAGERAELRLRRRGPVGPEEEGRLAIQLANLAAHPWTFGRPLGWGEIVTFGADIPTFPGHRHAFLAGPWTSDQAGFLEAGTAAVRIVNVVPISAAERAEALTKAPEAFFSDLLDRRDVLAPSAAAVAADGDGGQSK
ncbi:suppressor of fused domain protein [Streptacidiphilus jeojiense]|uniref:suppressor of fused domain protein n=1 Tax=Streptacidiphilus jeojiense TaxID=436229 RepID=UPI0004BF7448|nr:suppressor of fused domain protein [Streptacidiphilus jeojiense]